MTPQVLTQLPTLQFLIDLEYHQADFFLDLFVPESEN